MDECEATLQGALQRLAEEVRCWRLPPREVPAELLERFTMSGQMALAYCYRNDTLIVCDEVDGQTRLSLDLSRVVYRRQDVEACIADVQARRVQLGGGLRSQYQNSDRWLYDALGGLLYLSVPINGDVLCWNVNRIYGPRRITRLLDGWEVLAAYGAPTGVLGPLPRLEIDEDGWRAYAEQCGPQVAPEWVWVLRNV
jgi:hypothetical protein